MHRTAAALLVFAGRTGEGLMKIFLIIVAAVFGLAVIGGVLNPDKSADATTPTGAAASDPVVDADTETATAVATLPGYVVSEYGSLQ
jgi:hypothetical protein